MNSAVLCAVMMTVAIDYGYEPMSGDGIRYIIQIEPELLDVLRRGEPVGSTIPPELRGRIYAFQIVSNNNELSKEIPPLPEEPASAITFPGLPSESTLPPDTNISSAEPDAAAAPTPEEPQPPALPEHDVSPVSSQPRLLPDSDMVIPASGMEPATPLDGPSGALPEQEKEELKTSKTDPWFLLMVATLVASGSSMGMLYFGWLAFDYRSRYLGLLRDTGETGTSWRDFPISTEDSAEAAISDRIKSADVTIDDDQESQDSEDFITIEEKAWTDLGDEKDELLDDWLNEDLDEERRSRRNRKKSR